MSSQPTRDIGKMIRKDLQVGWAVLPIASTIAGVGFEHLIKAQQAQSTRAKSDADAPFVLVVVAQAHDNDGTKKQMHSSELYRNFLPS